MNLFKFFRIFSYVIIGASILVALVFGYWLNQPEQVTQLNKPIAVVPTEIGVGGFVQLDLDYCKKQSVQQVVRTSFVSKSKEIFQPVSTNDQKKGCYKSKLALLIPSDLTPGTYTIKFHATSRLNPFRTVVEEFITKEFTIK